MKYIVAFAAVAAAFSAPAAAQVRVGIYGGADLASSDGEDETGLVGGVSLGYDQSFENRSAFGGIELTADLSTVERCDTVTIAPIGTGEACVKLKRDFGAVLRAGIRPSPTSKLYILGGYANARARFDFDVLRHDNLDGVRLGGGYEMDVGQSSFAKLEYRYTNYEQDLSRHQLLAGFGFKF